MTFPQQRIDRLTEQIRAALAVTCPTCRIRAGNACVIDGEDEGVLIHAKRMARSRRMVQIPSLDSRDGAPRSPEFRVTGEALFDGPIPGASVVTPEGVVSLETYAMQLPTVEESAARFHEAAAEDSAAVSPYTREQQYWEEQRQKIAAKRNASDA